jgi:hypothetical protein
MYKRLLLAFALLGTAPAAYAQKEKEYDGEVAPVLPIDPDTHLVAYTGVVEVPGATQAQLYSRAYEWVAKNFNSAQNVIQMQDKESGKIIAKGVVKAFVKKYDSGYNSFTLSLYLKDGKYKYDITNFSNEHKTVGTKYGPSDSSMGKFEQEKPTFQMAMMNGRIQKFWNILRYNNDLEMKATVASLEAAMTAKTKDKSDF